MRFKLDENLPVEFASLFRRSGHDAVTVLDQGLGGARDHDLLDLGLARILRRFEGRHAPLAGPAPQPLRLDLRAQILDQQCREDLHGRLEGVPYSTGSAKVNRA